ncbi:hypothetical protein B0H11DRAFT_1913952 [Mycena galericulata]|nr:hypothetical protein B0H11DRAFT_1913952 [Mycena galericulata]
MPAAAENKCRAMVLYQAPRYKTPSILDSLKQWFADHQVFMAYDASFALKPRPVKTPVPRWGATMRGWDNCQLVEREFYEQMVGLGSDGEGIEQAWLTHPFLLESFRFSLNFEDVLWRRVFGGFGSWDRPETVLEVGVVTT